MCWPPSRANRSSPTSSQGHTPAALNLKRREYDEHVACADAEFGRLLDWIDGADTPAASPASHIDPQPLAASVHRDDRCLAPKPSVLLVAMRINALLISGCERASTRGLRPNRAGGEAEIRAPMNCRAFEHVRPPAPLPDFSQLHLPAPGPDIQGSSSLYGFSRGRM